MKRKVLSIIGFCSIITYLLVSMSFISATKSGEKCTGLYVELYDSTENTFFSAQKLKSVLIHHNVNVEGLRLDSINTDKIEEQLVNHPWLCDVRCFKTVNSGVKVVAKQREPLFRVLNASQNFYVDAMGVTMPIPDEGAAHVVVVTGKKLDEQNLANLGTLVSYISSDEFLKAQIVQIDVDFKGNVKLIPRMGKHVIHFGSIEGIDNKFNKLKTIYTEQFATRGWNLYREIDLRYDKQVVCTKK